VTAGPVVRAVETPADDCGKPRMLPARGWPTVQGVTTTLARIIAATFSPQGLRVAVPLALASVAAAGAAFAAIEDRSLGDGMWWAFVTVTTVGYGDVTPVTTAGRIVAVALMLGGIGFLLVLAGALVEHFVAVEVEEQEVLQRLEGLSAQIDDLTRRLEELPRDRESGRGESNPHFWLGKPTS
jgi:voltage-gated potassium channel